MRANRKKLLLLLKSDNLNVNLLLLHIHNEYCVFAAKNCCFRRIILPYPTIYYYSAIPEKGKPMRQAGKGTMILNRYFGKKADRYGNISLIFSIKNTCFLESVLVLYKLR